MQVSQSELITSALAGKVVSFPTDTVPALAVKPENSPLIFAAKQRPSNKPLILMGASFEDFVPYIQGTAAEVTIWQQVAQKYFPGALTLVLPASDRVPAVMNPTGTQTIGIRIPNHPIAQEILRQTKPLATTSANLSGQPPLRLMGEIESNFPQVVTLDGGNLTPELERGSGTPSTVAKWTGTDWCVIRQGSVQLAVQSG